MFCALRLFALPDNTVFSITIGESEKLTNADWILSDPAEVLATIISLNRSDGFAEEVEDEEQSGKSKRNSKVLPVPRSYLIPKPSTQDTRP